jgi:hypothetical protein
MAAIHVLDHVPGTAEYRVAVHWVVPGGTNSAGITWVAALLNSGMGGTTVLVDGDGTAGTITSAEKAAIVAGTTAETVDTVRIDSVALGNANAFLDAQATRIAAEAQTKLAALLKFWGATRP